MKLVCHKLIVKNFPLKNVTSFIIIIEIHRYTLNIHHPELTTKTYIIRSYFATCSVWHVANITIFKHVVMTFSPLDVVQTTFRVLGDWFEVFDILSFYSQVQSHLIVHNI